MSKADVKFHNTALRMNKALFELLDEKEFKEITVTDVCKKSKVNRSTFYAHYDNTNDLLLETKNNFVDKFFSGYKMNADEIKNLSPEDSNFITDKYLIPYLQFIKDNKKFYKIFMQNINILNLDDIMELLLNAVFIPICKKHNMEDETIISFMARYYLMGINSVISLWLERDCIDDYHLISEIIIMCVRPNDKI